VRLAIQRQTSCGDCNPHELRKSTNREWLSELGADDRHMIAWGNGESLLQLAAYTHFHANAGLAARITKFASLRPDGAHQ